MVSTSNSRCSGPDRFPGGEVTNLLFNYFEGSNEGIIGGRAEMRDSMVKSAERPLEGGKGLGEQDIYEIPLRLPMSDGAIETAEYM